MNRLIFLLVFLIYNSGFSQIETDSLELVKIDSLQLDKIEDAEDLLINKDTIFFIKSDSLTFKIQMKQP